MGIGEVFKYINKIPDVAVYVLTNKDTKSMYINNSTKLRSKFGEIADLMVSGGYDNFEYFEISPDPVYKLVMSEKVRLMYINKGFVPQNKSTPFIKFKVKSKFGSMHDRVLVYIESARGHKQIVGVFGKVKDADEFVARFYGSEWQGEAVYALNSGTREYVLSDVYKHKHERQSGILIESNVVTQIEGM